MLDFDAAGVALRGAQERRFVFVIIPPLAKFALPIQGSVRSILSNRKSSGWSNSGGATIRRLPDRNWRSDS